jgi:RHS repeat-associated protein
VTQDGALSTTLPVLNEAYTNDKIGNMTSKAGVTITAPATARYGFESYTVYSAAGQCYCFAYAPNTGAWVFSGAAGVSENGTCLTSGNPPTPHMTRTAFLQTGGRMAITVTGLTVSETYRIGFVMARRGNYNAHLGRTFTVTMGGQNLGVYSPMTTTWEQALTAAVVANATSLQLVLEAGAEPGNDSMALIDDVAVMGARPHAARAMGITNTYAYDPNGNMIVRREMSGTQPFVYTQGWTVDNRLASVIKSDLTGTILATTTIGYDGDGVRVKKSDPSGVTYYLGAVEVLITGTTLLTTSYYAFGGAMVAMRTTATATLTYLHGDHLGSTSLTTNASGQKVSEQRYKPYGEVRWSSGAGMPTDFTFTSQRAGPANYVGSLTDYVARFYSPALGRFISADTIVPGAGNSQALNRYSYVAGRSLTLVDPTGHCGEYPWDEPCKIEEMVKDALTCKMDEAALPTSSMGPARATTGLPGAPDLSDQWMVKSGTATAIFGPLQTALTGRLAIDFLIYAFGPKVADGIAKYQATSSVSPQGVPNGVSVSMGRFPFYVDQGRTGGLRYFDLGKFWDQLERVRPGAGWESNLKFMDFFGRSKEAVRWATATAGRPFNPFANRTGDAYREALYLSKSYGYKLWFDGVNYFSSLTALDKSWTLVPTP